MPKVGWVNKTAEKLCEIGNQLAGEGGAEVKAFTHPYGCSQMGDDTA